MERWLRRHEGRRPTAGGGGTLRVLLLSVLAAGLLAAAPAWATDTVCDGTQRDGGNYICDQPGTDIVPAASSGGVEILDKSWEGDPGSSADPADDGQFQVDLSEGFTWYGTTYDTVYISTNGYVTFASADAEDEVSAKSNPTSSAPNAAIYAYGDDLDTSSTGFGAVYYEDNQTCGGNTCFVVEWNDVERFGEDTSGGITVELGLIYSTDQAKVEITAESPVDPGLVPQIVGTENADGSAGLWYKSGADEDSRAAETGSDFLFEFSPPADNDPPQVDPPTIPADDATDVGLNTNIVIDFDEAMDTANTSTTISPALSGKTESWSNGDTRLTVSHDGFAEWESYTVTVTGQDTASSPNALDGANSPDSCAANEYCFSFQAEDNNAPAAVSKQTSTSSDLAVNLEWADLPNTAQAGGPDGVLVLKREGQEVTDAPVDGTSYTEGELLPNGDRVICNEADTATNGCADIQVSNNSTYHYQSFAYDAALNYSPGNDTLGIPKPESNFTWAYKSDATVLNRPVPIPNQQIVATGNDRWVHNVGDDDGLRSGWDPPVVGDFVEAPPNAVDLDPDQDGTTDLTGYVSAQDGFLYRFDLEADGTAEFDVDVIAEAQGAGTCASGGVLQAASLVMFDEFNPGNSANDDVVVQATRCAPFEDNAVLLLNHDLTTVHDTYTGGGDGELGISNAKPRVLYGTKVGTAGNGDSIVYVPLRADDTEATSLVALKITGDATPEFFEWATITGQGDIDAAPEVVRRGDEASDNELLLIGNTDGEIYLTSADTQTGGDLSVQDLYTDATGDGAVKGIAAGNALDVGLSNPINYVVWTTDTTVHGIVVDDSGVLADSQYWSQNIDSPSEPLVLQYGGNTYAYVGAGDGYVYELDARNGGTITESFLVEAGSTVGEVSLDSGAGPGSPGTQGLVAGTTSGRIYWVSLD